MTIFRYGRPSSSVSMTTKSLVVLLEHDDYDEPDYAYKVYATVDKRDAMGMARRLNVSLTDLPAVIFKTVRRSFERICTFRGGSYF